MADEPPSPRVVARNPTRERGGEEPVRHETSSDASPAEREATPTDGEGLATSTWLIGGGFATLATGGLVTIGALSTGSAVFGWASNAVATSRAAYVNGEDRAGLEDAANIQALYSVVSVLAYTAAGAGVFVATIGAGVVATGGMMLVTGSE